IEGKYNNLKNENKLLKSKVEEQRTTISELERTSGDVGGGADTEKLQAEAQQLKSQLAVQESKLSSLRAELAEAKASEGSPDAEALRAENQRLRDELK